MNYFSKLSDDTKGILLIIMGLILALNAFGMLGVSFHFLVLLVAIGLIASGLYLLRDKVMALWKRIHKKR